MIDQVVGCVEKLSFRCVSSRVGMSLNVHVLKVVFGSFYISPIHVWVGLEPDASDAFGYLD